MVLGPKARRRPDTLSTVARLATGEVCLSAAESNLFRRPRRTVSVKTPREPQQGSPAPDAPGGAPTMNLKSRSVKLASLAAVVAFPLSLAACGGSASTGEAPSVPANAPSSSAASSPAMTPSASANDASAPFGSGCSAVPKSGKGSFDGMSQDPVATAASNNPVLSTLVTAVKAAGLVDTLNNTDDITVFAPTND